MSPTFKPWIVNPVRGIYRCIGSADHSEERMTRLVALGKVQFEALSVGEDTHDGRQVAIVPLDESNEANARLIAAAPELLDIAKRLLECAEYEAWPNAEDIRLARAAIARVEGHIP